MSLVTSAIIPGKCVILFAGYLYLKFVYYKHTSIWFKGPCVLFCFLMDELNMSCFDRKGLD